MSQSDSSSLLIHASGLPRSAEGDPVFAEPWQAKVFGLTLHLYEKGLFTWSEWADHLSGELHRPGRCEGGSDYFEAWTAALSQLLEGKGILDPSTLLALQQSWQRAAEATPHGQPILLANDPQRRPD
ncbi:nitrile hydratase accessory protein [Rhizobium sp. SSA_523]|uniref:nitrile hydratase accessory protein n=1 Tax=Rhizobium sp. SSA_523 TaxID=2952477 RepID=UPI002090DFE7|nr:nitrile hydratase accessory protein [Rhizobium sp. SSA_523]MCO5730243.1 nitrile hydratase accessory protein [Rhizobium sp. SSA_523]WKC25299.1 nitrile hydratase accessory protein [Rhizobium sp. SSA_523]